MQDIKVKSALDFKSYFNISLLISFGTGRMIVMSIFTVAVSYTLMGNLSYALWQEILFGCLIFGVYSGLIVILIYFSCRRNMKTTAALNEVMYYAINPDKIEVKSESMSSASNWQYVTKLVMREDYFLLMLSGRRFYYLPKKGFESDEEMAIFKKMVKDKGIKFAYR